MYINTPRLEIYPERIRQNAQSVIGMCREHGAQVATVSKVLCAEPAVVQAFIDAGADMVADSRTQNLRKVTASHPRIPRLLLRLPASGQAEDVVNFSDLSLNSSAITLKAISEAATKLSKIQKSF